MSWAGVIGAVATGLAAAPMSGAAEMSRQESLLSALAAAAPPLLRHRLALMSARDDAANDAIEPVIYQNELPVRLLADGIVTAAVREVAGWRAGLADGTAEVLGGDNQTPDAIVAIVAVAALSTLRLELADCGTALDGVRRRLDAFDADEWPRRCVHSPAGPASCTACSWRPAVTVATSGPGYPSMTGSWPRPWRRRSSAARPQTAACCRTIGCSRSTYSAASG